MTPVASLDEYRVLAGGNSLHCTIIEYLSKLSQMLINILFEFKRPSIETRLLSFPLDPVFHIFTSKYVIFGTLTGLGKWGFDYNWEHGIYPKS